MNNRPIGVFDSGLGGLTVLREIMKITPSENIVYFGDTARVPYGPRSKETIMKYTFQAIDFLISKNVKAIVIACNTATARALKEANEKYDLPIIGVIEAGARTAAYTTNNKIVGIIGTDGTIRSKAYNIEIAKIDPDIKIIDKACPLFVPIVEEGWANTDIASLTAKRYLEELMDKGIDSLVLGCTHYPLLKRTIGEIVGEKVKLVNPAKETAKDLKQILEDNNMLRDDVEEVPKYEYYVSDIPEKFAAIAEEFLKKEIDDIKNVEKIGILIAVPYEECLERNNQRERKVPEDVIKRMYYNIYIPQYYEGFDEIRIHFNTERNYWTYDLLNELDKIPQDNPHHTLTIGKHCKKTAILLQDFSLFKVGLLHDIGKSETKTFINTKGEKTEVAHFYNHEKVSAYMSLFYTKGMDENRQLEIANLIQWHMLLHRELSEKTVIKYKKMLGEETWRKLNLLYEADLQAK